MGGLVEKTNYILNSVLKPIFFIFLFFLVFDFCRYCVVIRFFHPQTKMRWP